MKKIDYIFALGAGAVIGYVFNEFLIGFGILLNSFYLTLWIAAFSVFSAFCLWLSFIIGKRFLFVFQAAKYMLLGGVATVTDIKIFELLSWIFTIIFGNGFLAAKAVSFLIIATTRYFINKYWIFKDSNQENNSEILNEALPELKYKKTNIKKEVFVFFAITIVGVLINVSSFYFFTKILGPQFLIPENVWIKLSVILAAITAFLWNFLGYKFIVFKK